jgi:hypothetical protein
MGLILQMYYLIRTFYHYDSIKSTRRVTVFNRNVFPDKNQGDTFVGKETPQPLMFKPKLRKMYFTLLQYPIT